MNKRIVVSPVVAGHEMRIGQGFNAMHFTESDFQGMIDPVVMLDHFHMTAPTFEPHPHAGISAVTYVFEDSASPHHNYDSLGNQGPIHAGDLHWFVAGRGAVHTEQPEGENPHVHALQIFVNLPAAQKMMAPHALHVDAADMPVFQAPGVRVRVAAGESQGLRSPAQLPQPFTLLDGFLEAGGTFEHAVPAGWNAMIYAVQGTLGVSMDAFACTQQVTAGQALGSSEASAVRLTAADSAHFVILSGPALREPMVKHGPLVMNTLEQMNDRLRAYRRGEFGRLELPTSPAGHLSAATDAA
ncbi:pirin family protein [Collimonas sp.]|jgi:redox-sensitive bicupin YhaK (pirin superfamily)|uniref:pirin family protein n=1 Tax=Collimonas sp. TaxID=1963772 RepID=UPI002CDEFF52|nr:pirin-like C-terminal cupin domain-containing protein [Collimonas sp.]HWX01828.1 pirin-like C-terminal cupin domain-containing protein [Collimonas sp.]